LGMAGADWHTEARGPRQRVNDTARPDLTTFTPARPLTGQQRRVVVLLVGGLGYKRIAHGMGISVRTVKMHVKRASAGLPGEGSPRTKLLVWAPVLLAMPNAA
jgi:DNA-binding CsgD family transcriptional regulator